jgi:hypothetical protein
MTFWNLDFPKILMEGWTICYEISRTILAQSNDRIEHYVNNVKLVSR